MTLVEFTKKMQKFDQEAGKVRKQVFKKLQKSLESDNVPAHRFVTVLEPDSGYTIEVQLYPRNYSIRFLPAREGEELSLRVRFVDLVGGKETGTPQTVGPFTAGQAADEVYAAFQSFVDTHWPG
ncbi:MAG TPA: hypothetical protein VMB23_09470 [Spirochaetia bacterium]|jgi:hypothetical protein|nr:hypothetical protein [Spirochaetia bacterium]